MQRYTSQKTSDSAPENTEEPEKEITIEERSAILEDIRNQNNDNDEHSDTEPISADERSEILDQIKNHQPEEVDAEEISAEERTTILNSLRENNN